MTSGREFQPKFSLFSQQVENKRFGIVVSQWNEVITEALYQGAYETLLCWKVRAENILRSDVPGSYELPLAAQRMAKMAQIDAVICLGCLVQGETPHFDYICAAVANGLMRVGLDSGKPVSFGVITALNQQQALDRAGGKHGNKGDESALAALAMLAEAQ